MSVQHKLIETIQCEKGLARKQMLIKFFSFKIHMCNIGSRIIAIYIYFRRKITKSDGHIDHVIRTCFPDVTGKTVVIFSFF